MAEAVITVARSPLSEASNRINSPYATHEGQDYKTHYDPYYPTNADGQRSGNPAASHLQVPRQAQQQTHPYPSNGPSRTTLKPPQETEEAKRLSQASYDSSVSGRSKSGYKSHIGPWQLGRTLGKGSSARVRLCRHVATGQLAAVKIVNRRMAYLVQDSSLAALSKLDSSLPDKNNGEIRVPMAIEREVAILKLIEHPNIMKLYDIWENRSEVYVILEYIEQGDLFTFINMRGRLNEQDAIYFFRQIISAITYCHSFNICHRDLKPENILITDKQQIKIADFGMAALHQTDTHHLVTACGSPHYAAPELLKNRQYRGDRADIWSMGVILFAMLSATLPFDDPDIRTMMSKVKKGHYEMPAFFSPEAEDLIRRMLQTNPDRRITLKEIWRHPLIQKYAYLDNLGETNGLPPDIRKGFQYSPVPRVEVDPQLLRQLRSMWHMFSENDLMLKLTCEEPNDQKAFYWLLYNYREQQLEDFKPELTHSMSDYHHLRPSVWKKRVSTCEFAKPRGNGHGRSISRFTVISNAAESERLTAQNNDGNRAGLVTHRHGPPGDQSTVTVHRHYQTASGSYSTQASRQRSGSTARRGRMASRTQTAGRLQSSTKGSLSSVHSSRPGTPHGRSLRHKRGVDFSHMRKRSNSTGRAVRGRTVSSGAVSYLGHPGDVNREETPEVPRVPSGMLPKPVRQPATEPRNDADMFNEELRHFSSNIAKDCDEAFKSSLMETDSIAGSLTDMDRSRHDSPPYCLSLETPDTTRETVVMTKSLDSRPLPPLPASGEVTPDNRSIAQASEASRPMSRDESDIHSAQVKLALPILLAKHSDRRIVSAPAFTQRHGKPTALPSINEGGINTDKARIVSAPPHTPTKEKEQKHAKACLSQVENSIRVVHSPSAVSPVKAPEPLNVRKKASVDNTAQPLPEVSIVTSSPSKLSQGPVKKKKSLWFKRASKVESEKSQASTEWQDCNSCTTSSDAKNSDTSSNEAISKKKSFNFPFWKSNKQRDSIMSISRDPDYKSVSTADAKMATRPVSQARTSTSKWHESGSSGVRNIEVKQNWLARLFRVKPATSHLCMAISRRRARQEVTILLREWRKYGIRGVQVDKQRNIVFARVGAKNFLNLKEVSFAAEIMTVIEHGKKQPLSIIRFTQERGAASSLHRVVDTIKLVFDSRGLTVADSNKRKMMIKTLNS